MKKTSIQFAAMAALLLAPLAAGAAALFGVDLFTFDIAALFGMGGLALANGAAAVPIAEQVKLFEAKRTAAQEKAGAIIQKSIDEGRTLDEHETEEHSAAAAEVDTIDKHLALLKAHEKLMLAKAKPVEPNAGAGEGAGDHPLRGSGQMSVKSNLAPGIRFTRFALAMMHAKGNVMQAHEIAKVRFKDTPEVINCLQAAIAMGGTRDLNQKAAVAAGTTTDTAWAGPLVQYQDMESEFVGLLRPRTILGRMTQLNRVPFMMRTVRQLTGASGSFVGEGAPKPVNRQTYDNVTLGFAKVAVIVVMTEELARFSSPDAELRARDDMLKGMSAFIDRRFIDPAYSAIANISPASITNGARRVQATGSTIAAIDATVQSAMAEFTTSNVDPSTAVWVMSPATALRLSMKRTTQDELAYPGLTMNGGVFYGLPVITSSAMAASGSPSEAQIALVTQEEVFYADDGGITIDMSTEAAVQLDDAPSAGAQSLVSLWQNNLLALRAEKFVNWAPRRANSLGIVLIENTNW